MYLTLAMGLFGCAGAKQKALESALYEIWNEGNLEIIDDAYEPELAYEVKEFVRENRELYPDIEIAIEEVIVKGPHFVTLWSVTGTHRAVGRSVTLEGVSVRRREGGRFVEESMFFDMKAVYDQLGFRVVPPDALSPFEAAAGRPPARDE